MKWHAQTPADLECHDIEKPICCSTTFLSVFRSLACEMVQGIRSANGSVVSTYTDVVIVVT